MLADDCKEFLEFIHQRDPVAVIEWSTKSEEIEEVERPWDRKGWLCLWNQALLPTIDRKFIPLEPRESSYYRIGNELPVIEFSYPSPTQEPWNGRQALLQGRVWASFENPTKEFTSWYNAVVRWIRKRFVRDSVILHGYIGPAAYDSYTKGGLLLPQLRPPITKSWLSWVEAQDQHRAVFVNPQRTS